MRRRLDLLLCVTFVALVGLGIASTLAGWPAHGPSFAPPEVVIEEHHYLLSEMESTVPSNGITVRGCDQMSAVHVDGFSCNCITLSYSADGSAAAGKTLTRLPTDGVPYITVTHPRMHNAGRQGHTVFLRISTNDGRDYTVPVESRIAVFADIQCSVPVIELPWDGGTARTREWRVTARARDAALLPDRLSADLPDPRAVLSDVAAVTPPARRYSFYEREYGLVIQHRPAADGLGTSTALFLGNTATGTHGTVPVRFVQSPRVQPYPARIVGAGYADLPATYTIAVQSTDHSPFKIAAGTATSDHVACDYDRAKSAPTHTLTVTVMPGFRSPAAVTIRTDRASLGECSIPLVDR